MKPGQLILERPRLNSILEKASGALSVFVTAGEGYGKTCAIRSFLAHRNEEAVWISLSERDNDPSHFWESVVKAVGFHDIRAGKILEEIGFPESPGQITRCLSALSGSAITGKKYFIVADDCHLVREKAILKFAGTFLASHLRNNTIILIYRTEPKLNTVALLSKGIMARVNSDDLRFTEEEIAAYFSLGGIDLSRQEVKDILSDTEGWALAISLIAQELKNGNKTYSRSLWENGKTIATLETTFASLAAGLRRFLVVLSLFNQWPLEALEKIAASFPAKIPPMDELAENLNRLSSFFGYDPYIHGFRIHHVFLDYLREKQKELSLAEIKTACNLSAQWCMENHLWTDAAINYSMAGNYEGLLKAVYSFPRLIARPIAASILEIIERVLKDSSRNEADENFLFLSHVTKAGMLLNLGRFAEARTAFEKAIQTFADQPQGKIQTRILSACYNSLASLSIITYRKTGDINKTLEYFERGYHYYMQNPFTVLGPGTKVSIGSYASPVGFSPRPGEYEEFIKMTSQCIPYASKSIGGFLSGMDSLCRCELSFFRGDLDAAEQHARETVFAAGKNFQYETESKALFYLLRIHLCGGNTPGIRETWEQMEALSEKPDYINRYAIHDITAGWFHAHTGEPEQIAPWLREESEESGLNLLYHNYETMVKAKSLFAEKQYSKTVKFLEREKVTEGLGSFHLGRLEITVLKAAACIRTGEEAAALAALETAFCMAVIDSAAFDLPFIELGEDMRRLALAALKSEKCAIPRSWLTTIRSRASVYAKKLAAVKSQHLFTREEKETPFLSSREISILTGISRGFTREEIAETCSLSINAVKSIIKSLYAKLGAINRADVIRIATKLDIL